MRFSFSKSPVVTQTTACSGSLPVAKALGAESSITYNLGFGIPAPIHKFSATDVKSLSSFELATLAPEIPKTILSE